MTKFVSNVAANKQKKEEEIVETETGTVKTVTEPVVKEVKQKGRPAVYTGHFETQIVKVLGEMGLTEGRKYLAETGIQVGVGKPIEKVTVSMPTLSKLAQKHNLQLRRGRPKKVVTEPVVAPVIAPVVSEAA